MLLFAGLIALVVVVVVAFIALEGAAFRAAKDLVNEFKAARARRGNDTEEKENHRDSGL